MSPVAFLLVAWRRRDLLGNLVHRDVVGRYRGSAIGVVWSLVTPVLMLMIYTFVFSVVFKARWGSSDDSRSVFAINLFAGMIVHGLVAECLNRAPSLVLNNVNYVKRVIFPLELLCWMALGSALFHALIGFLVLILFFVAVHGFLPPSVLLLPLVWLPLLLGTLGVSWVLASLGVYLRDISQLAGLLTTILMFMSPVFYPADALPQPYRSLLYANPLTFVIEQTRQVLVAGQMPDWSVLALAVAIGWCMAMLGYEWFEKTRRGFSDVL